MRISRRLAIAVLVLLPATMFAQVNQAPKPSKPGARTDIYHVFFAKAALGKANALADLLRKPDPKAPMPGHFIVLRHQEGDDWDYCVIEHLGTKATVEIPTTSTLGDLVAWHTDAFVSGPTWAEFEKTMGLGANSAKTGGSVYVVATWLAAPGHRDQLDAALAQANTSGKVPVSAVTLQHVEGGAWNFLTVERYNSWQDFATDEAETTPQTGTGKDGWSQIREHGSFHRDTITDRIAPK